MSATYNLAVVEEHGARPGLVDIIKSLHAINTMVAADLDVPDIELTVVLTGDLTRSIRAWSEVERDFRPERGGGTVKGKTIGLKRDFSETVIVLDSGKAAGGAFDEVEFLHLAGHEYGHVLLGRLRAAAGTRPPKPTRDLTPEEVAAIWAYEAADEFRCDLFSNVLLEQLATMAPEAGGKPRPVTLPDVVGDGYSDAFVRLLDDVYPGWPDLVHAYRVRQIGLNEMYGGLLLGTQSILNLIAHGDAVKEAGGEAPLLSTSSDHPAVKQLLGPAWSPIREVLNTTPAMPPLADFERVDRAIQECGQHIVAMWESLGVSGYLTKDEELHVSVT